MTPIDIYWLARTGFNQSTFARQFVLGCSGARSENNYLAAHRAHLDHGVAQEETVALKSSHGADSHDNALVEFRLRLLRLEAVPAIEEAD